jgi:uracil phosphoribosyltransferase
MKMKNVICIDHPVLKQKLGELRNINTSSSVFKNLIKEITQFLVFEATRDLKSSSVTVDTPRHHAKVSVIDEYPLVVSIMRAGNGMLEAATSLLPESKGGHIGIYRDHSSHNTIEYYLKLPKDVVGKTALLLDPVVGTGDTIVASIDRLKAFGITKIDCLAILGSEEGLAHITDIHPDVSIYVLDAGDVLSEDGYLLPGIGDVGDRIYNTN